MKNKTENNKENKTSQNNPIAYGVGSFFLEITKIFLMAIIIIVPIRMFLFQPFFVQGASMEPNFEDGQYLIVNELGYKKTDLGIFVVKPYKKMKREEIVVFHYPRNHKLFFIKRIIGLPDETIKIHNGKVMIYNKDNPNGFELKESYLPKDLKTKGDVDYKIKSDEYYVLGDNRTHSSDSRIWGPIKTSDVVGRVFLRAWPINKASLFLK